MPEDVPAPGTGYFVGKQQEWRWLMPEFDSVRESDLITVFNALVAYGLSGDLARALIKRIAETALTASLNSLPRSIDDA